MKPQHLQTLKMNENCNRLFQNWQKSSIISNIALYKCFIDKGISKNEAKELVKEYSFYIAKKAHKILKIFFISQFFWIFPFIYENWDVGQWNMEKQSSIRWWHTLQSWWFKCLWVDTCEFFGCPKLCEIFCLCNPIVFGNINRFVFERSQTLGMKGDKCDFCFINVKKHQMNKSEKIWS